MKHVLVVGGAGYIGSHTAKALAASGYEPVVLDDLSSGHQWAVRWGPLVRGNMTDRRLVTDVIQRHRIGAVLLFAANAYVGESMLDPRKYFENNVINSLSFLHALMDSCVSDVVFSSSCATYGIPADLPIVEEHLQRPVNPYGESKLFVERVLHWYGRAYGLRWVSLRYFNAAGADPEGEIGEEHDPEPHLIPLVIRAGLGRHPYVEICGTDYPTPDGTAVRDYIHVTDLADAHVLALKYLLEGGKSTAINLGTGRGHSVKEVISAVERATGRRVPVRDAPRRHGDPPALVSNPEKAFELIKWRPRFSSIEMVVETTLRWYLALPRAREVVHTASTV
ncbi:MAG: UDP-glucose 4-epimerase GalE [Acidobacteriota bacterium]